MGKLVVLVAESCAGKDTVLKVLVEKYGLRRIVSHTTRPIRVNETNGIDYHFINKEEFLQIQKEGKFVEVREYNTIQDGEPSVWYYGVTKQEISFNNENAVIILDMEGLKHMENFLGKDNMLSIYIKVNDEERVKRAKNRGDNIQEVMRRLKDDKIKFANAEQETDTTIYNCNGLLNVEDIAWIINDKLSNPINERK